MSQQFGSREHDQTQDAKQEIRGTVRDDEGFNSKKNTIKTLEAATSTPSLSRTSVDTCIPGDEETAEAFRRLIPSLSSQTGAIDLFV